MAFVAAIALGYVLGSIPFGLIVGRMATGGDIRAMGSGNTGTTNVMRTAGMPAGIAVLALDMGKAALAVVLARLISDVPGVHAAGATAALVGHVWPVFVGFRGGRGTAPGWGALAVLSPTAALAATALGMPAIGLTRYVSLGSLVGTTTGAATLVGLSLSGVSPLHYFWYGAIGAPLVVIRHRDNIRRLLSGQERRLGEREGHHRRKGVKAAAAGQE